MHLSVLPSPLFVSSPAPVPSVVAPVLVVLAVKDDDPPLFSRLICPSIRVNVIDVEH